MIQHIKNRIQLQAQDGIQSLLSKQTDQPQIHFLIEVLIKEYVNELLTLELANSSGQPLHKLN